MFVSFGNASGAVEAFNILMLSWKGSLFCTRPTLAHYTATRADLLAVAGDLFNVVETGAVKIHVGRTYPLNDAAQAHRDLESRATVGSVVLLP
jgi:NADPH2:quinone reductase